MADALPAYEEPISPDVTRQSVEDALNGENKKAILEKPKFSGFRHCIHNFKNIDGHFADFVNTNHFYAELWRHVRRVPTRDIPFAAIGFDERMECYVLGWNPDEFAKFTKEEIQGILQHEILHVVWNHVSMMRTPRKPWNIAEDLAINSIVLAGNRDRSTANLPAWVLVPGRRGSIIDREQNGLVRLLRDDEKDKYPMAFAIEELPTGLSSYEYYSALEKGGHFKNMTEGDHYIVDSGDAHPWDEISDKDQVGEITRGIISKAVKTADAMGGWGNISSSMQAALRSYINRSVNWTEYLAYFIGTLKKPQHESTLKRLNRRFPMIHPGVKLAQTARILVAIDASGSVNDKLLELLFSAIRALNEEVTIDIIQFDCSLDASSLKTWDAGQSPPTVRELTGGTDFNAPTDLVNLDENDGRWDALMICTDGEARAPGPCKIQRTWLLPSDCKLHFQTDEMQIVVTTNHTSM